PRDRDGFDDKPRCTQAFSKSETRESRRGPGRKPPILGFRVNRKILCDRATAWNHEDWNMRLSPRLTNQRDSFRNGIGARSAMARRKSRRNEENNFVKKGSYFGPPTCGARRPHNLHIFGLQSFASLVAFKRL